MLFQCDLQSIHQNFPHQAFMHTPFIEVFPYQTFCTIQYLCIYVGWAATLYSNPIQRVCNRVHKNFMAIK